VRPGRAGPRGFAGQLQGYGSRRHYAALRVPAPEMQRAARSVIHRLPNNFLGPADDTVTAQTYYRIQNTEPCPSDENRQTPLE